MRKDLSIANAQPSAYTDADRTVEQRRHLERVFQRSYVPLRCGPSESASWKHLYLPRADDCSIISFRMRMCWLCIKGEYLYIFILL